MAVLRTGKPLEANSSMYDDPDNGRSRVDAMRRWHHQHDPKSNDSRHADGRFGIKNGIPRKFKHRESFD